MGAHTRAAPPSTPIPTSVPPTKVLGVKRKGGFSMFSRRTKAKRPVKPKNSNTFSGGYKPLNVEAEFEYCELGRPLGSWRQR